MNWLLVALGTVISYSAFDFFVKLSSDKLNAWFNAFWINFIAVIAVFIFLGYRFFQGDKLFEIRPDGIIYSTLAGIAIAVASLLFSKMFSIGVNLSVGVPIVRVGMVLIGSILGVLLLREPFNIKYIIGVFLSMVGLFLIIVK